MNNQEVVAEFVAGCQAAGRWKDRGRWVRARNGVPEYWPTRQEIAAKCRMLRTRAKRHGAHARPARPGRHAVPTSVGHFRLSRTESNRTTDVSQ